MEVKFVRPWRKCGLADAISAAVFVLEARFFVSFLPKQWRARSGLLPLLAPKDLSEGLVSRVSPRCGVRGSTTLGSAVGSTMGASVAFRRGWRRLWRLVCAQVGFRALVALPAGPPSAGVRVTSKSTLGHVETIVPVPAPALWVSQEEPRVMVQESS